MKYLSQYLEKRFKTPCLIKDIQPTWLKYI